ncbi:hypothetical protein METHPM2_2290002 [Pseudomonas sp. PM2]
MIAVCSANDANQRVSLRRGVMQASATTELSLRTPMVNNEHKSNDLRPAHARHATRGREDIRAVLPRQLPVVAVLRLDLFVVTADPCPRR